MPLYKTITVSETTQIYIWKVTEPEEELAEHIVLTPECKNRIVKMKSNLHRRAFLSIRHLLKEAGYEAKNLYYNEFGKPHLFDKKHISITHSGNFTAIIISDTNEVGIDIEKQRDKILRIAYKFTPIQEYKTLANSEALIRKLTIVWGAKESLYKIYSQPGLSFLNHIHVKDFSLDDANTSADIIYQGKKTEYSVTFFEIEDFTCVYATN